jgi:methylase of polypeptide subunit release factors
MLVEHGHNQSAAICKLLNQLNYSSIKTHQDLAGISRVVTAHHPSFAKLG